MSYTGEDSGRASYLHCISCDMSTVSLKSVKRHNFLSNQCKKTFDIILGRNTWTMHWVSSHFLQVPEKPNWSNPIALAYLLHKMLLAVKIAGKVFVWVVLAVLALVLLVVNVLADFHHKLDYHPRTCFH